MNKIDKALEALLLSIKQYNNILKKTNFHHDIDPKIDFTVESYYESLSTITEVYLKLNKPEEVISIYEKQIQDFPNNNAKLYSDLAQIYSKISLNEKAKLLFKKSCNLGYKEACK
jgi:tetratricopeptide (TPR) repeat protein